MLMNNQAYDGVTYTFSSTPGPLGKAVEEEVPGVARAARIDFGSRTMFRNGDKSIYANGNYTDPALFRMLELTAVQGSLEDAFNHIHSLVITEKLAGTLFGNQNPIGQQLVVNNEQPYVVKAVINDPPLNSSYQFEWLAPFQVYESQNEWLQRWGNNGIRTIVELEPSADVTAINESMKGFIKRKMEGAVSELFLHNMNRWHLYNNFTNGKEDGGRIQFVKLFTTIGWIILLIACINFMNLSTARSGQRSREVGVRKVLGAIKPQLITQFISESMVMSFIAVIVSILIILLVLPSFNSVVEKELSFNLLDPIQMGGLIAIGAICGLVAGSYPAFYLSSFNPIQVLKGVRSNNSKSGSITRKCLVVVQFTISVVLIIATIIISRQVDHVQTRELGFDKQNLVYLSSKGEAKPKFNLIRTELINSGKFTDAALSASSTLNLGSNSSRFSWQGKDPNKEILITMEFVSPTYMKTMDIKFLSGQDFNPSNPTADSLHVIINKSLADIITKGDAVGSYIQDGGELQYKIIGVVDNFIFNDMYAKPEPVIFFQNITPTNLLNLRIRDGIAASEALNTAEQIMKKHNPAYPFEYQFMDEVFDKKFKTEILVRKLAYLFSILAIIISCLGLFGLAAYTAERRTKEIGIRKVLGATVSNLTALLSKEFLALVGISCLIAFPIAWWMMQQWLENFAFRIDVEWWVFILAGSLALVIAILTVSVQAAKAALANPIRSLRSE